MLRKILENKVNLILILLLVISFCLRIWAINYPASYMFDEVYYSFTAQEYLKGNPAAFEYWSTPPKDKAYAWVNPPLPQEIMTISMFLTRSSEVWVTRLPGVFLGVLSIYLVYKITKLLFKKESTSLISAFLFSIDGLNFVQSRIAMLDIYLVTFILSSLFFSLKRRFFISSIFLGLALASKWTALYFALILLLWLVKNRKTKEIFFMTIIPIFVYLAIYIPFFLTGHNLYQFKELIQQEIWYHTNLKATHDYASSWWSWPLNLYPVWYFVDYQGNKMANIFSSGNPVFFWAGSAAIVFSFLEAILKKVAGLGWIVLLFLAFWLPWAASNRIMFLYYFSPAVPFMSMALGYQLEKFYQKDNRFLSFCLAAILVSFILVFPFLVGILLPKEWVKIFFATNLTKNPF